MEQYVSEMYGQHYPMPLLSNKDPQLATELLNSRSKTTSERIRFSHFPSSVPAVGTVTRTGMVKMVTKEKRFKCKRCATDFTVPYSFSAGDIPKPIKCPSGGAECGAKSLEEQKTEDNYCDFQEIRVQEKMDKIKLGRIPRSISVFLADDLVDTCQAGDHLTVVGTPKLCWNFVGEQQKVQFDLAIEANNIQCHAIDTEDSWTDEQTRQEFEQFWSEYAQNPLKGRDAIVTSFSENIYGMCIIKLSILLAIIGGVPKLDGGIKVRGEPHILLVGDPGTGKSQFLKQAFDLIPSRSVLTTGVGSTTAGLTCSATRDSGEWQLEAGALVLADGGLCCIDEFGSIRETDKTAIHEAMEQQTLSVAKAGLVCKLNTRCSVLAAMNPKGSYDFAQSPEVNLGLASPLLSRFDLVFVLIDKRNENWDRTVSSFILNNEIKATKRQSLLPKPQSGLWTKDSLRKYISFVKTMKPVMEEQSKKILASYYQLQRRTDSLNSARTTIRMLESLIRLAQAHARLMMRPSVTIQDSIMAIIMMENSLMGMGIEANGGVMHAGFNEEPDLYYATETEPKFLSKLL